MIKYKGRQAAFLSIFSLFHQTINNEIRFKIIHRSSTGRKIPPLVTLDARSDLRCNGPYDVYEEPLVASFHERRTTGCCCSHGGQWSGKSTQASYEVVANA